MNDIVQKLDNWARYSTAGQKSVLIEARDEIERLREALNADSQTMRLHLGEMTQQEMRTVKAAFAWVLSRAALKGDK